MIPNSIIIYSSSKQEGKDHVLNVSPRPSFYWQYLQDEGLMYQTILVCLDGSEYSIAGG